MSEPLLTICIPTYRRAALLARSLGKLYAPGLPRVNVIVGNNASPDDTETVVQPYLGKAGFRYFRNSENIGGDRNLLKIIEQVQTPFFMILTDDDYIDPEGLLKLLGYCKDYPSVGAIISPLYSVRDSAEVVHVRGRISELKAQSPGIMSVLKYANLAWAWSRLVFAREAFDIAKARQSVSNCYYMIIMLASVCRTHQVLQVPDRLVMHTIENEVFWDHIGTTQADRRLVLDKMMLSAMEEIYGGSSLTERFLRWYYLHAIAAEYVNADDGLPAIRRLNPSVVQGAAFLRRNFVMTDGSSAGAMLAPFVLTFSFIDAAKKFYRTRLRRYIGAIAR